MSVPAPPPALPLEGRSVLVVDDEAEVCEMLVEFLEHLGARVDAVLDGRSALEHLRGSRFDALVTDMRMPRLSGMELINAARQFDPGIVVIVMTGYASFDSAIAVVRMGAHEYLRKPFDVAEVQRALTSGFSARESHPIAAELAASLALSYAPSPAESAEAPEALAARLARLAALAWDVPARDLNAAGLAEGLERTMRQATAPLRVEVDRGGVRVKAAGGPNDDALVFARPAAAPS
jgi:DNA-binding NtrC family response regulator